MKTKETQDKKNTALHFAELIIAIVLASFIARFIIRTPLIDIQESISRSMVPTINPGEASLSSSFEYCFHEPERGDFVAFMHNGENGWTRYGKRVVGLPGDIVEIVEGKTYINGELYNEPWLAEEPKALNFGPFVVPEEHIFVMGDNRNNSYDSRYWDDPYVSFDDIIGKTYLIRSDDGVHAA